MGTITEGSFADNPEPTTNEREMDNSATEQPEQFGEEEAQTSSLAIIKEDVSDADVFRLAKQVLLCVFILFLIIALCRIFDDESKGVSEVWDYSKVILNSISSLVLGLYFGKKK